MLLLGCVVLLTTTKDLSKNKNSKRVPSHAPAAMEPQFPPWMMQADPGGPCRKTPVFPFRVGCPSSCQSYGKYGNINKQEPPMYRTHVAWKFGYFSNSSKTFQGSPEQFTDAFRKTSTRMEAFIQHDNSQSLNTTGDLRIKHQTKMHLSLAYLCCIAEDEKDAVHEALEEWASQIDTSSLQNLKFDRLECWHERINSVTTIIIGDQGTQKSIWPFYADLVEFVRQRVPSYDPLIVPRWDQMPYHITLMGVYNAPSVGGPQIDPVLPSMAHITNAVTDDTYGPDASDTLPPLSLDFKPYASGAKVQNE